MTSRPQHQESQKQRLPPPPEASHYQHQSHLVMPRPTGLQLKHGALSAAVADASSPSASFSESEGGGYSMPSPISPRATERCPSLTESTYSSFSSRNGCSTPGEASSLYRDGQRGSFSSMSSSSSTGRDMLRYTHGSSRIGKAFGSQPIAGIEMAPLSGYPHGHDEKLSKHEKRRRNHLNSEKKRRENIKSGMDALFQLVPACRDQQESKANILKKAKDYILAMQTHMSELESDCRRVTDENKRMKKMLSCPPPPNNHRLSRT